MKKYLSKKLKCDIRIRIQTRQENQEFKDDLRIDLKPYMFKRIYIKYRGREEIITLTELCKRGIIFLRELIKRVYKDESL